MRVKPRNPTDENFRFTPWEKRGYRYGFARNIFLPFMDSPVLSQIRWYAARTVDLRDWYEFAFNDS